jgi:hypothetical protein
MIKRTPIETKILLDDIQDRLENLEIEYNNKRKALFERAEEIRREA